MSADGAGGFAESLKRAGLYSPVPVSKPRDPEALHQLRLAGAPEGSREQQIVEMSSPGWGSRTAQLMEVFSKFLPSGDCDHLRDLIKSGKLDANECIGKGPHRANTLLHWSARHGHARQTAMLLECGADPTLLDLYERTPAEVAEGAGNLEVVAVLKEAVAAKAAAAAADADADAAPSGSEEELDLESLGLDKLEPMSNVCPGDVSAGFLEAAAAGAQQRAAAGYDEAGRQGGPFTKESPPPGKAFGGYLKGCMGVTWVEAAARSADAADAADGPPLPELPQLPLPPLPGLAAKTDGAEVLYSCSPPEDFSAGEWVGRRKAMYYDKDGPQGPGYYRGGKPNNHGGPNSDDE